MDVACAIAANFRLDALLLIPSARPPHKDSAEISHAWHRFAMTVLGTITAPSLLASAIELQAPQKPYTFETVQRLKAVYGSSAILFFVMGSDSFEDIGHWREPRKILAECNVIVAGRPGWEIGDWQKADLGDVSLIDLRGSEATPVTRRRSGVVYLTEYVLNDTSSTELRRRAREGLSVRGLVPDLVADYIEKYGLYRSS